MTTNEIILLLALVAPSFALIAAAGIIAHSINKTSDSIACRLSRLLDISNEHQKALLGANVEALGLHMKQGLDLFGKQVLVGISQEWEVNSKRRKQHISIKLDGDVVTATVHEGEADLRVFGPETKMSPDLHMGMGMAGNSKSNIEVQPKPKKRRSGTSPRKGKIYP